MQKESSMPGTALSMSFISSYFTCVDFKESINVRGLYDFHFTVCTLILFTC